MTGEVLGKLAIDFVLKPHVLVVVPPSHAPASLVHHVRGFEPLHHALGPHTRAWGLAQAGAGGAPRRAVDEVLDLLDAVGPVPREAHREGRLLPPSGTVIGVAVGVGGHGAVNIVAHLDILGDHQPRKGLPLAARRCRSARRLFLGGARHRVPLRQGAEFAAPGTGPCQQTGGFGELLSYLLEHLFYLEWKSLE